MNKFTIIMFLIVGEMFAYSQDIKNADTIQYPILLSAEMPLYPPIARGAHLSGVVKIYVSVEDGVVKHAELVHGEVMMRNSKKELSKTVENKLLVHIANPSLKNVETWEFVPEYKGGFTVTFIYEIEGEETIFPENPKVEMELPFVVKVKIKPVKPTQT